MDKTILVSVLLAILYITNCQEEEYVEDQIEEASEKGKTSYSYSYGVADGRTGDIKTVWESRDGDTVKGHYSVVEPDGSTRSVEYSTGPKTGFQVAVNNENDDFTSDVKIGQGSIESKALRDYEKYEDFPDDDDDDEYYKRERKRTRIPYESIHGDYLNKKRIKFAPYSDQLLDSEPSDFTHSITIKHPHDDSAGVEPLSHVEYSFDPNCKTKIKKESYSNKDNLYSKIVELELNKKYPRLPIDLYTDTYDKYAESSHEYDRYVKNYDNGHYKGHKYDDWNTKPSGAVKYTFPVIPDIPHYDKHYPEEFSSRPKKKRPHKHRVPEERYPYISEDLSEYTLVPQKKLKKPAHIETDYRFSEDEYDQPQYSNKHEYLHHDDKYHSSFQDTGPKEIIRKIVKRKKPAVSILDMFDI